MWDCETVFIFISFETYLIFDLMMQGVNMFVEELPNIWKVRRSPGVHHTVHGVKVRTPENGGSSKHCKVCIGRLPPILLVCQHASCNE